MTPQEISDEITDIEKDILRTNKRIAKLAEDVDQVARDLNAAGEKVRACESGEIHMALANAGHSQMTSLTALLQSHCLMIEKVEGAGLPLPMPRAGGR